MERWKTHQVSKVDTHHHNEPKKKGFFIPLEKNAIHFEKTVALLMVTL